MTTQTRVAVLGAGNGGQALAADLARRGCAVTLFEHPDFAGSIAPIVEKGEISVVGAFEGTFPVSATTSAQEAAKGAEYLFMVSPSFAQLPLFQEVLPHIEEGSTVIFIPGNFFSFEASRLLREQRPGVDITLAETDTLPYACRLVEPGTVNIWGVKNKVNLASLPGNRITGLIENLKPFFVLDLWEAPNILGAALNNMNLVIHSSGVLLNAGRIEATQGGFRFYTDGITPVVGYLQEKIDKERQATGKAYGLELRSAVDFIRDCYSVEGDSLYEVLTKNPAYGGHGNDAPKLVNHRYVTEDVPYLIVPMLELAERAGLKSPVSDALVTMWSEILDRDFRSEGRTLAKLGLNNMTASEIAEFAAKGC